MLAAGAVTERLPVLPVSLGASSAASLAAVFTAAPDPEAFFFLTFFKFLGDLAAAACAAGGGVALGELGADCDSFLASSRELHHSILVRSCSNTCLTADPLGT